VGRRGVGAARRARLLGSRCRRGRRDLHETQATATDGWVQRKRSGPRDPRGSGGVAGTAQGGCAAWRRTRANSRGSGGRGGATWQ
jgi:hypothetical protein